MEGLNKTLTDGAFSPGAFIKHVLFEFNYFLTDHLFK